MAEERWIPDGVPALTLKTLRNPRRESALLIRNQCGYLFPEEEGLVEVPYEDKFDALQEERGIEALLRAGLHYISTRLKEKDRYHVLPGVTWNLVSSMQEGVWRKNRSVGEQIRSAVQTVSLDEIGTYVVPFYIHALHTSHVLLLVLASDARLSGSRFVKARIVDSNGTRSSYLTPLVDFLTSKGKSHSLSSNLPFPDVVVFTDSTDQIVNFGDDSFVETRVSKGNGENQRRKGYCAFFAILFCMDVFCTGDNVFSKGHQIRLVRRIYAGHTERFHRLQNLKYYLLAFSRLLCEYTLSLSTHTKRSIGISTLLPDSKLRDILSVPVFYHDPLPTINHDPPFFQTRPLVTTPPPAPKKPKRPRRRR